jgi:hypothetical protein
MFSPLLDWVNREFGEPGSAEWERLWEESDEREWHDRVVLAMSQLIHCSDLLQSAAHAVLGPRLFSGSTTDFIHPTNWTSLLCRARLRPSSDYYRAVGSKEPRPANPNGDDSAGAELTIDVNLGWADGSSCLPPAVYLEFNVWGEHERASFAELYRNYRRVIELILKPLRLRFETAVPFDSLEKYRGNDTAKRLDLYLAEDDPESNFSLYIPCWPDTPSDVVASTYVRLAALYDACLGYAAKPRRLDVILEHYHRLP